MEILIWILAIIVVITIHEAAHAWMADRLGDPTPRLTGRLSLNPVVHYDLIGTTLLFVTAFLSKYLPIIPFGWAKPVSFDPFNLKNPRRDSALISLAGPLSNFLLAGLLSIIIRLTLTPFSPFSNLANFLEPIIMLNVIIGVFNLIPIHPLDGGKIFVGLLPPDQAREADQFLERYGLILLFFLIFPSFGGQSPLFSFLNPIINFILRFLIPNTLII